MTNETPSNKTPQTLTFSGYINQQIQEHEEILPRVLSRLLDGSKDPETVAIITQELLGVIDILKTAEPNNTYKWYKKSEEIVAAVMEIRPSLDQKEVTTAVGHDMADLLRGCYPLKVGRAEH